MIGKLWRGFHKLHIGLYFLFAILMGLGSFTADFFESYSLVDLKLVRVEWKKSLDAKARGEKYVPPPDIEDKIFRPLNIETEKKTYHYKKGEGWNEGKKEGETVVRVGSDLGSFSFWLLVLWLVPLYLHHFSKKPQDPVRIERRIINLPLVIFALVWVVALYRYFAKVAAYGSLYEVPDIRIKTVFIVSSLIFGTFASFLNLELTQIYINRRIAGPFFRETNPHGVKRGFSVSLTLRYALMMFSVAAVPLLLSLYVPVYFNFDSILEIVKGGASDAAKERMFFEQHQIYIPCMIVGAITGVILVFQAVSVLLFKLNVQGPMNALIRRMKSVAQGDFECKSSVLYSDEIGQLKGHFNMMLDGLQEREKIKDTFGKYVSMEIAEKIMKSGKVNLAGEEIEATILFSDIRDFTPLSEKLSPPELIKFLNVYFSHITGPIMKHKGVINKFIGDAVMAIFSPVFGTEDHAEAALRSALEMRGALKEFNADEKHPSVAFGVGLHTGALVAGNVGTENRLEYTVLGDTVNVASRIESQTKAQNTEILISGALHAEIDQGRFPAARFVECGPVLMKGKSEPLSLYKVEDASRMRPGRGV